VRLVPHEELAARHGITHSYAQTMRMVAEGEFPKPIRIGRRNYWLERELNQFIAELVADRDGLPRPRVEIVEAWSRALPHEEPAENKEGVENELYKARPERS